MIYEGLLFIISIMPARAKLKLDEIELPDDAFEEAFNKLDSNKIESISIVFTGNDNIDGFIRSLGLSGEAEKKTYRSLLRFLKEKAENIRSPEAIDLTPLIVHGKQSIDLLNEYKKPDLSAPSLMKIERYAGFTSIEDSYTTRSIRLRFSPDVWMISLLGVYSSFVTRARYAGGDKDNFYFLLFSPEEILNMFAREDSKYAYMLMNVKNEIATKVLAETLRQTYMEEAIALEVSLNLEILKVLREHEVNKLSLSLIKISPEGQTYKIYEYIPLTLSREAPLTNLLSTIFGENGVDKALKYLARAVDPRSYLLRASSAKEAKNWPERDYAVKAVLALHRLVSLGDLSGLRDYARYLGLAVETLQSAGDRKSAMRRNYYEYLLRKMTSFC